MEYARQSKVSVGSRLRADDGFTCLADGAEVVVEGDDKGLFVRCDEGSHYLDGQLERGRYVGLTLVAEAAV